MKWSNLLLFFILYVIIKLGDSMRKFLGLFVLLCIFGGIYFNRNSVINFLLVNFADKNDVVLGVPNQYYREFDYGFVQNTDNLYASSRQDILNIIYTSLNRGLDTVTFYCKDSYNECINDVNDIASDNLVLSTINNLVHPFNSFKNIYFSISSYGKVVLNISRVYSDEDILFINAKIDEITNSIIDGNMSNYDKILAFHDYIVNNTSYDSSVSIESQLVSETNSNKAYGLLADGKAICSGYSDTMAIFLNRLGINNYKISSDLHIWNLVYIDGVWKHLDVTWDDPVTSNGQNVLLHTFFLINSDELFSRENDYDMDNHKFRSDLYLEA